MHKNGFFKERTHTKKIHRYRICNADSGHIKRLGRAYSRISGNVAVEFCIRKYSPNKRISGMGPECFGRHLIRPEKH